MKPYNRVYAKIDLDAVAYNMEQMKRRIGEGAQLMAVVKTDGYGHGAVPIARLFEETAYVWGYATASLEEAVLLRDAGLKKPILVLGCVFPEQYEEMVSRGIRAAVYTKEMAEGMSQADGSDFCPKKKMPILSGRSQRFRECAWRGFSRILQRRMRRRKVLHGNSMKNLFLCWKR